MKIGDHTQDDENKSESGNTKGGSITAQLTSCLTSLDESVLQKITKIVSSQEVNGKVIL